MNKPFKKIGFLGLIVIAMSIMLTTVFPSKTPWMMDGFLTPIMAFEFVQSQNEVNQLFGLTDLPEQQSITQSIIRDMNFGNQLDYIYMVLYASFLFFFSLVCAGITGQKQYYAASIISIVILFADAFENIQLLSITSKINHLDFTKELTLLHRFTWVKWGGLAIFFLILVPYFIKGRIYSKLIAFAGSLSFILSVLAYFNRSVLNELMGLSVALMFIMMIIYCFTYKIKV
jgi:hypothetical protein